MSGIWLGKTDATVGCKRKNNILKLKFSIFLEFNLNFLEFEEILS